MKEIEKIIDESLAFFEDSSLVRDSLPILAKAIEQYVLKARIEAVDIFADKYLVGKPLEQACEYVQELNNQLERGE